MNYAPVKTPRNGTQGRCNDHCPEGCACALSADIVHTLHICSNPQCACHSAERYQPGAATEPETKRTQTHRPVLAKAR